MISCFGCHRAAKEKASAKKKAKVQAAAKVSVLCLCLVTFEPVNHKLVLNIDMDRRNLVIELFFCCFSFFSECPESPGIETESTKDCSKGRKYSWWTQTLETQNFMMHNLYFDVNVMISLSCKQRSLCKWLY